MNIPIGMLLATALIGLWISPDPALSRNRLTMLILGMGCFVVIVPLVKSKEHLVRAAAALILLGIGVAVLSLIVTNWSLGILAPWPALYSRIPFLLNLPGSGVPHQGVGVNPRVVAGAMAFLLPLPLAVTICGQGRSLRWLGGLAAAAAAILLLLSQSPQGFLALALALGVMLIWRKPRALWALLPAAVALCVTWWLYRWWLPAPLVHRLEIGIGARLSIWPRAWLMIRDMPFTGVGLNDFPVLDALYSPTPSRQPHAHNVFMQTATDQGILGLVAFVALFAAAFAAGWRAYRASDDPNFRAVMLGCAGGCVAYLGFGLWDSMTLGYKAAPALWMMLGLLAAGERIAAAPERPRLSPRTCRWLLMGLAAVAILAMPVWAGALCVNVGRVAWHRMLARDEPGIDAAGRVKYLAQMAIALYPYNSRAWLLAGLGNLRAGDARAAVSHLERAVSLDRSDPLALFQLAEAYAQLGQIEHAVPHWRAAGAAALLYQHGVAAQREGDQEQAARWFQITTEVDPEQRQAWLGLARAQSAQQEWEAAAQTYREVIQRFPHLSSGYEGLAGLLYQQKDSPAARQIIEAGLAQAEPPGSQLYYLLSRLEANETHWPAAEQAARQAITLTPANGAYLAWLGDVYARQKRYAEALAQYDLTAATASAPAWLWRVRQRKGNVYAAQQAWPEAVDEFEAALQISIQQNSASNVLSDNYAALGNILVRAGDPTGAIEAYQKAIAHNPDNQTALKRLAELRASQPDP